jgi:hypothetical protein
MSRLAIGDRILSKFACGRTPPAREFEREKSFIDHARRAFPCSPGALEQRRQ